MNRYLIAALGALVLPCAIPCQAADLPFQRIVTRTSPLDGATALHLRNENGDVHLIASDTSVVQIHVRIQTDSQASADAVTLTAINRAGSIDVSADCPKAGEYRFIVSVQVKKCDVEYDITYPRHLALTIDNRNGDIQVDDPKGSVTVRNVAGDVTVTNAATTTALSTRFGNVEASFTPGWSGSSITETTSTGNVYLHVPSTFRGRLHTHTGFGRVNNDVNLIGSPNDPDVSLRTSMGNVTIDSAG